MSTRRVNGAGSIYRRKSDGRLVGSLSLGLRPDGSRHRIVRYGDSEAEVQAKLNKAMRDDRARRAAAERPPTIEKWATAWLDRCEADGTLALTTIKGHRQRVRAVIVPAIGGVRLDQITVQHVRRVRTVAREQGLSDTSIRQAHAVLSSMLSAAVEDELMDDNPAKRIKAPRKSHYETDALTLEESTRLLEWAREKPWHDLRVTVALLTGLRSGEALGLTRQAIDLERGEIRVVWQLQRVQPGKEPTGTRPRRHLVGNYWLLEPKAASRRLVPMLPRVWALLAERLDEMPDDPWALVFTGERGGPMSHERDWARWRDALDGAGLRRIRRHDSRHTTATLMRAARVDARTIQAILGHTTAAMTDHYAHGGSLEGAEAARQLTAHVGVAAS